MAQQKKATQHTKKQTKRTQNSSKKPMQSQNTKRSTASKHKKRTAQPKQLKQPKNTKKTKQGKQEKGTILVTGSAGFIGMYVAKQLLDEGYSVIGIDNINRYYDQTLKRKRNKMLLKHPKYRFFRVDVANYARMKSIFAKYDIDTICHLAAQAGVRYSLENPFVYETSNNRGALTIFELAHAFGVTDIVYASSSSVYGGNTKVPFKETDAVDKPVSLYAATKKYNELLASTYHSLYGIRSVGLRFFTVYGPYGRPDMALFTFTKKILEGEPIDVYNKGNMYRDFTYVTDIADGVVAALKNVHRFTCEVINLGNSNPVKLTSFIKTIEKHVGTKAKTNLLPMQKGDVYKTYADITKAKRLLKYRPQVSVDEGVKSFVDWYRKYYEE
jgi:UDP-glucuronate 4-epimerase